VRGVLGLFISPCVPASPLISCWIFPQRLQILHPITIFLKLKVDCTKTIKLA
jgi:hypothetical protein